jgi:hypothetical protein
MIIGIVVRAEFAILAECFWGSEENFASRGRAKTPAVAAWEEVSGKVQ